MSSVEAPGVASADPALLSVESFFSVAAAVGVEERPREGDDRDEAGAAESCEYIY